MFGESREKEIIVYVTATGSKYHRDHCSYLRSKYPIKLANVGWKYDPCSRCSPPSKILEKDDSYSSQDSTKNSLNFNLSGSRQSIFNNNFNWNPTTSLFSNSQNSEPSLIMSSSPNNYFSNRRDDKTQIESLNKLVETLENKIRLMQDEVDTLKEITRSYLKEKEIEVEIQRQNEQAGITKMKNMFEEEFETKMLCELKVIKEEIEHKVTNSIKQKIDLINSFKIVNQEQFAIRKTDDSKKGLSMEKLKPMFENQLTNYSNSEGAKEKLLINQTIKDNSSSQFSIWNAEANKSTESNFIYEFDCVRNSTKSAIINRI